MRNNKAKLAFEMLEKEMEVIESEGQMSFKGGTDSGPITWSPGGWVTNALSQATGKPVTSGIDAEGNWVIKIGDATPIPLTYTLEEVTITPVGKIQYVHEDVDSWLDIFNLPPETNNYEQNPGFSGIILPQENPWGLPTFEEFYANINPAVFNGAGNSDTEGYDYLTGYNSAGYNSAGYNSFGINSTTIGGLDAMIGSTTTSVLSQFQQLTSNPWSGQNGLTTYTGIVQNISSSSSIINMDLTIDNGVTSSITITTGPTTLTFLKEGGFTFGVTIGGTTITTGMSVERGILFGQSITNGSAVSGQEYNHIPGWGDVAGALAIFTAIETGGYSLEVWGELASLAL